MKRRTFLNLLGLLSPVLAIAPKASATEAVIDVDNHGYTTAGSFVGNGTGVVELFADRAGDGSSHSFQSIGDVCGPNVRIFAVGVDADVPMDFKPQRGGACSFFNPKETA